MADFDKRRALLMRRDIFEPFHAMSAYPLRIALSQGELREDAPVLVLVRGAVTLVLMTRQLLYHHVAQGEVEGEPWMVSY